MSQPFSIRGVDRSLPPSEVLGRVEPKIPVSSEHDQCGPESEELDSRPGPHFSFHSPFPSNLNVKLEPFSTLSVQRWRLEHRTESYAMNRLKADHRTGRREKEDDYIRVGKHATFPETNPGNVGSFPATRGWHIRKGKAASLAGRGEHMVVAAVNVGAYVD